MRFTGWFIQTEHNADKRSKENNAKFKRKITVLPWGLRLKVMHEHITWKEARYIYDPKQGLKELAIRMNDVRTNNQVGIRETAVLKGWLPVN
jgi:hypothetical protein